VCPGSNRRCTIFHAQVAPVLGFNKKHAGTCYAELMFLHLMGSAGHIVHSCVSEVRNVNALFFKLGWARCGFYKKRIKTHYAELAFLHPVGSVGLILHFIVSRVRTSVHSFSCSSGPSAVSIKSAPGRGCTIFHA
jgi:hypothetical protein